ncbi:DEAD-box ATP-dependent RNA helicase 20 [Forsythia ovata]|uniref:DEAD-box ATP-dependent RNA helicase 20 n=1 Tax=Forsythia ovata TaxID=205694 RepID=A0ABD1X3X3_9LAMI
MESVFSQNWIVDENRGEGGSFYRGESDGMKRMLTFAVNQMIQCSSNDFPPGGVHYTSKNRKKVRRGEGGYSLTGEVRIYIIFEKNIIEQWRKIYKGDSGFSRGSSYRSSSLLSIKRDYEGASDVPQRKLDLDGLTPFEKNFYVESLSMAAMSKSEFDEYRQRREITVEGKDVPKPVKSFSRCWVSRYNLAEFPFHV